MDAFGHREGAAESKWPRVIAHADMDAFYASVEQLDNPALRGLPVIVGGKSARGVVTSASYEARKFGVRSAMPSIQAQKLCPQAIFVAGRMHRYGEISKIVRRVFEEFSPIVEPLSLDEAFIDLTGTERVHGSALDAARALKRRVTEETGLIVSVGVAPIKMAAKILSDMSKPDGLLSIGPEHVVSFLQGLPVERIWGVGRVTLARLNEFGIQTVGDLARRDVSELRSAFGSMGPHLHALANGNDPRPVVGDWQRKSYGEENTFAQDLALKSDELRRILIAHGEAIARRLRADRVRARTVSLKLKLARPLGQGRYPILSRSFTLEHPTDDGAAITRVAINLLDRVPSKDKIRLAGVHVHNLERIDSAQAGLFEPRSAEESKRSRLNRALDAVTDRFGESAVTRGMARAERIAPSRRIK